jgi:hypothetical protein
MLLSDIGKHIIKQILRRNLKWLSIKLINQLMKAFLLICSALLLIGLADLPIGYYTFLRIVVTVGAIAIVVGELKNGLNFWVIAFGLIAILINPLIPVYLNDKETWMPIDIIAAILFIIRTFTYKTEN